MATVPRSNSRTNVRSRSGSATTPTPSSRRSSGSSVGRRRSSGRNSGTLRAAVNEGLDFSGLEATIEVMDVNDTEYEDTCLIFLSSRYQVMGPFHRAHKDSQLIVKDQWVNYWTAEVDDSKRIKRRVAAKLFDTCNCLAKGKSGVTPVGIDNLQKSLPRKYRSVTSAGAERQLSRFSWYMNGYEKRDISRPSQILTPQKYEELVARLQAEARAARDELRRSEQAHARQVRQLEAKLEKARTVVARLKAQIQEQSSS